MDTFDSIGELALVATAGIGGLAIAAQRIIKTWTSTQVSIKTDGVSNDIMTTLQEENRLLRENERNARDELNRNMREMGRLEAMELRVGELQAEIISMEERYRKQEVLMLELVKQNTTLLLRLDDFKLVRKSEGE